jgi:hypothetical protein
MLATGLKYLLRMVCRQNFRIIIFIMVILSVSFLRYGEAANEAESAFQRDRGFWSWMVAKNDKDYENLSPQEKAALKEKYEQWKSLTPEEKRILRERYKKLEQMSPQEQQKYRNQFQKLKNLPPAEQQRVRRMLDNWHTLTPSEKQYIRRLFQN